MPLNILHCQQPETWHSFVPENTLATEDLSFGKGIAVTSIIIIISTIVDLLYQDLSHMTLGKAVRIMIDTGAWSIAESKRISNPYQKREIIFKSTYMRNSYSHELGKCVASTKWVRAP